MLVRDIILRSMTASTMPYMQRTSTLWPSQQLQLQLQLGPWARTGTYCHRHGTLSRQAAAADNSRASEAPWDFGFQCNERLLAWDSGAQAQLIRIWLAQELHLTTEQVQHKLDELGTLLPDMVDKLDKAQAKVVYQLVKDPAWTARWLLGLRAALPNSNVSALVTAHPQLMLSFTGDSLAAKLAAFGDALPGVDVEELVGREPLLLRAPDIGAVLQDIRRLIPGADPVSFLVAQPGLVLDMEVCGQPSTLEHN